MKKLFNLFFIMFKIGLFTFGGGYAMIPLIENEFVIKKQLITHDEFVDMLAIAESTPGPIAINSATFIGYKLGRFWGSVFATLGVILPSFIIISLIALVFNNFMEIAIVAAAFKGIRVCVVLLIFLAGMRLLKKMEKNVFNWITFGLVAICTVLFSLFSIDFSSIYFIIIFGIISIIINSIVQSRKKLDKGVEK